ncbi:MAG TPA: phosphatase PAP2 family protein [Gaiellaceae bacterium]|nr:phosphatase PAP2 family protein [Gaiellaceae bacterium]
MADLDRDLFLWIVGHRWEPLDWLFLALSVAGHAGILWIALAPVLARRARRPWLRTTVVTAATVWTADLVAVGLKGVADRDRPYRLLEEAEPLLRWDVSTSLPSGHAATSAAGAVILAYLLGRWAWPLAALAAAVCYSRVYIGVHYPGDVLAGAAVGAAVALLAVLLLRRLRLTSAGPRRSAGATPGG